MKNCLLPAKLMICQLADGHRVRVVGLNPKTDVLRVKSLRTGLPFSIARAFVYDVANPAA